MTASRLSVLAAGACLLIWGLKAVAIWVAGGLDQSPLESPLFFLGLGAIVVAFMSLGAALTSRRPAMIRALAAFGGLVAGAALSALASAIAFAVIPDSAGWVQEEAGLWFSAVLAVALTGWHARGRTGTASA